MPTLNNKLSVLFCKRLRFGQLPHLEALGLSQLNAMLHLEHSLPTPAPHVDVDGAVLVAVEKELVPVFLEDLWHPRSLAIGNRNGDPFVAER